MPMTRLDLERRQLWIYLLAIAIGLTLGWSLPAAVPVMEGLLWPTLAALLFVTFTQVPILEIGAACRDRRFLGATLLGNFLVVPLVVWGLVTLLPERQDIRLGVLLVLLVPCTDWFITFCQLGRGDAARAIAIAPLLLVLQLVLLPLYLWLMAGDLPADLLKATTLWPALLVILVPLVAAGLVERLLDARPGVRSALGWCPVPMLALVIALVAGAQAPSMLDSGPVLQLVLPVFVAYLLLALAVAGCVSRLLRLPVLQGRCLAFSCGTRNSFVVLPVALTLPAGWELVAIVIVVQSLVELLGMIVYLRLVPRWWRAD